MLLQAVIFCLLWPVATTVTFSNKFPNCKTTYSYAKVCHHYNFQSSCVPWNLKECQKVKTTYHQQKCPKYECVSFLKRI